MRDLLVRWLRDDAGMESVEWAIVAVIFAIAAVSGWSILRLLLGLRLGSITGAF